MCLAVPGKVMERDGDQAVVDLQGNRLTVSTMLTPEAGPGDWVLIHAGFAITQLEEKDALETWEYLQAVCGDAIGEAPEFDPPTQANEEQK